jgi:hypothetical protein
LLTAVGLLHIGDIEVVTLDDISKADATRAGYDRRESLVAELNERTDGEVYRIKLGPLEPDPRVALRKRDATGSDLQELIERMSRMDGRSSAPWTRRTLELLRRHPAVRAADLCKMVGQDKLSFKNNVRRLKALGLTESLEIGYRLSPRGVALLDTITRGAQGSCTRGSE